MAGVNRILGRLNLRRISEPKDGRDLSQQRSLRMVLAVADTAKLLSQELPLRQRVPHRRATAQPTGLPGQPHEASSVGRTRSRQRGDQGEEVVLGT